jgi:hypothetical protein
MLLAIVEAPKSGLQMKYRHKSFLGDAPVVAEPVNRACFGK